jgi:glucose uptake protein GlcU
VESSPELTRYLVWGLAVTLGAVLAVLDWRLIRRPVFGALLLLGIAGGAALTSISPFNFADGGYYMEGILVAAGSALAFIGYFVVGVALLVRRLFTRTRAE